MLRNRFRLLTSSAPLVCIKFLVSSRRVSARICLPPFLSAMSSSSVHYTSASTVPSSTPRKSSESQFTFSYIDCTCSTVFPCSFASYSSISPISANICSGSSDSSSTSSSASTSGCSSYSSGSISSSSSSSKKTS